MKIKLSFTLGPIFTSVPMRPLVFDDLFRIQLVDAPHISPVGLQIAITVIGWDRDTDSLVTDVCIGEERVRGVTPCWSPNSNQIAYVATSDDTDQIWIWDLPSGQKWTFTDLQDGASQPCWSPDSRYIAYLSNKQVYVSSVEKFQSLDLKIDPWIETRNSNPVGDVGLPCWSPDGSTVAFVIYDVDGEYSEIWLTTVAERLSTCLLNFGGPIRALVWSPDGDQLAFVGHNKGGATDVNFGVWVVTTREGDARNLTEKFDRSVGSLVRADDTRGMKVNLCWIACAGRARIYFPYTEGGSSHIAWVDEAMSPCKVVEGERTCLAFDVGAEVLAVCVSDVNNPGEILTLDLDGSQKAVVSGLRIENVNSEWLREVVLTQPRRLEIVADDGVTTEAWLMLPATGSLETNHRVRYPLIVSIHGGPHYSVGYRFYFELHRLAALGYAVLYGNPRGSQGYGECFATAIRSDWGGRDYADLMLMTDAALNYDLIDPSRMCVTGVSYGGYMTHWIIGHTNRFRAAISENGIANLVTNFMTSNMKSFWVTAMGGSPQTHLQRYISLSPITYSNTVRTPLLMVHAEQDENCPISQSEELRSSLARNGSVGELVRIPDEGHWMNLTGKPSHRRIRAIAFDDWLEKWLGD